MIQTIRFLHTADLHLDSPLKSLARRDPALAAHVENATREALTRLIDLCLEEQVHMLLLAGDIYDSHNPSVSTVGFFLRELNRLKESGIRVFMIRGNHDHYSKLTNTLTLPEHVTEFIGKKNSHTIKELGVAIHGVSFKEEHATNSALRSFKAPDERLINVALLHTSLGGSEGHDIYAPCSPTELDAMGFDYWALGHIHKRTVLENTATIVMPGTPQGRDMGESGVKSVSLVTLSTDRCSVEERIVSPVQFERITINASGSHDAHDDATAVLKSLMDALLDKTRALISQHPGIDRWIIRVEFEADASTLYDLRSDVDNTQEAIQLTFETLGNVHLDKLKFNLINDDNIASQQVSTDHSLIKQLRETIFTHLDDEYLQITSDREFDDLIKLLPTKSSKDKLQSTSELRAENLTRLQTEGVEELLSLIQIDRTAE